MLPRARETAIAMGFAVDRELVTQLTDEDVLAAFERADASIGWYDRPDAFAALPSPPTGRRHSRSRG